MSHARGNRTVVAPHCTGQLGHRAVLAFGPGQQCRAMGHSEAQCASIIFSFELIKFQKIQLNF
jgi:hypothetical protein